MRDLPSKTELCLLVASALLGVAFCSAARAADGDGAPAPRGPAVTFSPSAQERARFEVLPDRTFQSVTGGWTIGNRARLGLEAHLGDRAALFVQIQDVRAWGSEYNAATLGEGTLLDWVADGLDVHQAYGQLTLPGVGRMRVGRQEIDWGGQRLIGAVGWTHQGRSFDAVRVWRDAEPLGFGAFYAKTLERPVSAADATKRWRDQHLIGLRAGPRVGDALTLDGLAIVQVDSATGLGRVTFGVWGKGAVGAFSWELDAYGQLGRDDLVTYRAMMVGVRAGVTVPAAITPYFGGGIDVLGGDGDATDDVVTVFDTLYATNHKFYGHLDHYLAIPEHTAGQGLVDGIVTAEVPFSKKVRFKLDAHVFGSAAPASSDTGFHGVELDTEAAWKPVEPVTIGAGLWVYVPAEGSFWGSDPTPELGAYVMTDFAFE